MDDSGHPMGLTVKPDSVSHAEALDAIIALRAAGNAGAAARVCVGLADGWAEEDGRHVRVGSRYSVRTPDHAPGTRPLGCALCRVRP